MERTRNEGNSTHHQQQDQQQPPPPPPARHHHPPPPARHHHQPPPHLKCPRCDSSNTKFCYYNNYSLSQPRYFCKACRRYWTHGGTLRNVPVGGGSRKKKRLSKTSSASNLSSPAIRSQNPTAVISGQPPRPLPPVIPLMGNSFYGGGGGFLPSFAAMQSLPAGGGNQGGAAVNLGGGQFGANMSLLQAMTLQSLKSHAANQFQPPANLFPAQQNLINPPIRPWTQTGGSSSSVIGSSFWNCATGGGGDQAGSSFSAPNQWSTDNLPGFNPQLANFSFIFWTCLKHLTVSSMVEVATDHQQSIPHFVFQTQ